MFRLALLVPVLVALTGCSNMATASAPGTLELASSVPSASAAPSRSAIRPAATVGPVGAACLTPDEQTSVVEFPSASGVDLGGVLLGSGPVGVVLAHETHANLCQWMPYARRLVDLGYRVLAFDLNGLGSSPASPGSPSVPGWDLDLVAAAEFMRDRGASRIVLVGANIGGLAALVAATEIEPDIDGVVNMSGMIRMSGMDGPTAAAAVSVPVLYLASTSDEYLVQVEQVHAATVDPEKRLELIDAIGHGVNLLDPAENPDAAEAWALIEAFIRENTAGD